MLGIVLYLCTSAMSDWPAREAQPFALAMWSAEVRDARHQRSLAIKRQFYGNEPWESWGSITLPSPGDQPEVKPPSTLQRLFNRKVRKRKPPRGSKGLLVYYHPEALTRSLAYLPGTFPLRHHTVRFVLDTQLDFNAYLKAEVASYRHAEISREPGSPSASIQVRNPNYDAKFVARNGGGVPPELLLRTTENTVSLLPPFFEGSHESFTIHYREVDGVFFKSAFKDVHAYPLRRLVNRIKSHQKNDFVVTVTAEAVPSDLRDAFLTSVTKQLQPRLQPRDAEPDSRYRARLAISQLKLRTLSSLVRDVRDVTVKISGVRPDETIQADLKLEARPGTNLARLLNSTRRRRPEAAAERTDVTPALSLQLSSVPAVRGFLQTQLQRVPAQALGQGLLSAAEAVLAETESVKLRLLQIDKRWVLSLIADGKLAESGQELLSSLNASGYLTPSGSTPKTAEFSIDAELREKYQLPDSLAVSIEPERLHLVIGPSSTLTAALASPVVESAKVFDVSSNLHALWQLDPNSAINPRMVIRAAERATHQMMLSRELPAKYAREEFTDESFSRQLFAASMQFDPEHHSLAHLFDEANSRIHLSANTDATSLRLRVSIGRAIVETIEARNVLVSQLVLADSTRRFRKLTPLQLLDEIESTGLRVPQKLRDRIRKAGDGKAKERGAAH